MSREDETPIPPPDYWASRADEARTLAHRFSDPVTKALMLDIANKYDHMATHAARFQSTCPG